MIEIGDKIISRQVFDRKFVCDLNTCKGACCVEGDSGAPLEESELDELEQNYDKIEPFMREEGVQAVNQQGIHITDVEGDETTPLIDKKECAFVVFDKNNIAGCAIEKAYEAGESKFQKPISCHLYPVRIKRYAKFEALNYDEWDICSSACECGVKLDMKVFQFLKKPLIRKYGQEFFEELVEIDKVLTT